MLAKRGRKEGLERCLFLRIDVCMCACQAFNVVISSAPLVEIFFLLHVVCPIFAIIARQHKYR